MTNVEQSVITNNELAHRIKDGRDFRAIVETPQQTDLGSIQSRIDLHSSLGPFLCSDEYKVQYPKTVTQALVNLFEEYNQAFAPLVGRNREWVTDYQFATSKSGQPVNYFVQVDMVGIPDEYLELASDIGEERVREVLRRNIFEIENSMAMYGILQGMFSQNGNESQFKTNSRLALDQIRQIHGMPIAILAVTDEKHQALRATEFGKRDEEILTDDEVRDISGFDRLFGPEDFLEYLEHNGGECDYLLYARTSDPVSKLRKPDTKIDLPLLEDAQIRKIIKAHAITFNVDDPFESIPTALINDTKAYLSTMGMGFEISEIEDLNSPEFKGFLLNHDVDPNGVLSGEISLRAKPLQGVYGCYGHVRGPITTGDFRRELGKGLSQRGLYVVQPEMPIPTLTNTHDGSEFVFIDRNFLFVDGINPPVFIGGVRSLMPADSIEAKKGRVHGSKETVVAEIS